MTVYPERFVRYWFKGGKVKCGGYIDFPVSLAKLGPVWGNDVLNLPAISEDSGKGQSLGWVLVVISFSSLDLQFELSWWTCHLYLLLKGACFHPRAVRIGISKFRTDHFRWEKGRIREHLVGVWQGNSCYTQISIRQNEVTESGSSLSKQFKLKKKVIWTLVNVGTTWLWHLQPKKQSWHLTIQLTRHCAIWSNCIFKLPSSPEYKNPPVMY